MTCCIKARNGLMGHHHHGKSLRVVGGYRVKNRLDDGPSVASHIRQGNNIAAAEFRYELPLPAVDAFQTVDIPDIHTTFFDLEIGETEDFVRAGQDITLIDRVYFTNLKPGLEYTVNGTIKVKETGEDFKDAEGNAYITTVVFTPKTSAGYVDVQFIVNTSLVAGKTLVAFETLDYITSF